LLFPGLRGRPACARKQLVAKPGGQIAGQDGLGAESGFGVLALTAGAHQADGGSIRGLMGEPDMPPTIGSAGSKIQSRPYFLLARQGNHRPVMDKDWTRG